MLFGAAMTNHHVLSLALFASLTLAASGCKSKDHAAPPAARAAVPAAAATTAPSAALRAAIAAVDACKPDDDCEALDKLYEADQGIDPAAYRGAIAIAHSRNAHQSLTEAVAPKLDEPLLLELERAADACPADQECAAEDDFTSALSELTPAQFRAGIQAAKTTSVRRDLLTAIRPKMDRSLIPEIAPLITDEDLGDSAQMTLAAIEDTGALAQLAALLDRHDHTDTIHSRVPELLAKYPQNPSVQAALPKLREMAQHDMQGWGKASAAVAIAKIQGAAAIPFLVQYIHAETWGPARAAVADQLASFKSNAVALAELKKLAKDPDKDVSATAAKALR